MKGAAYIFINYKQALKFGHVAWGFALADDVFCYGSSDHLLKRPMSDLAALVKYSHVQAGGDIDFWSKRGSEHEMTEEMRSGHHIRYHAYKVIYLEEYHPDLALQEMEKVAAGGWSVLTNNCIHHTHRILQAYGLKEQILKPELFRPKSLMPKHWFACADAFCPYPLIEPGKISKAIKR